MQRTDAGFFSCHAFKVTKGTSEKVAAAVTLACMIRHGKVKGSKVPDLIASSGLTDASIKTVEDGKFFLCFSS